MCVIRCQNANCVLASNDCIMLQAITCNSGGIDEPTAQQLTNLTNRNLMWAYQGAFFIIRSITQNMGWGGGFAIRKTKIITILP